MWGPLFLIMVIVGGTLIAMRLRRDPNTENEYLILTGNKYAAMGRTEAEALERFDAYYNGEDCPCGKEDCDCVSEVEADTWVQL